MKTAIVMMTTFVIDPESHLARTKYLTGGETRLQNYLDGLRLFMYFTKKYKYDTFKQYAK